MVKAGHCCLLWSDWGIYESSKDTALSSKAWPLSVSQVCSVTQSEAHQKKKKKRNKDKLPLAQFASNLSANVLKTPSSTLSLILNHITYKVWLLVGVWATLPQENYKSSCACLLTLHCYQAPTVSRWPAAHVLGLGFVLLTVAAAVVAVMIAVGEDLSRTCSQYTATNKNCTTPFSWSWQLKIDFFW